MGKSNVIDRRDLFKEKQDAAKAKRVATLVDLATLALDRCNSHARYVLCELCDPDNRPD